MLPHAVTILACSLSLPLLTRAADMIPLPPPFQNSTMAESKIQVEVTYPNREYYCE